MQHASNVRFEASRGRLLEGTVETCGALLWDRPGERIVLGNLTVRAEGDERLTIESALTDAVVAEPVFDVFGVRSSYDAERNTWTITGRIVFRAEWAETVGAPEWAGVLVGDMELELPAAALAATSSPSASMAPPADARGAFAQGRVQQEASPSLRPESITNEDAACVTSVGRPAGTTAEGSDVIVADLQSIIRYGRVGDITAYAVGTTACNIGTERASWISYTNDHPVIIQNLYRLKDGHFEQIGMSWVKHGFYAVSQSLCTPCNDPTDGSALGVGCSDPYSAALNGVQTNMSPRATVNAHTGYFPYPWNDFPPQDPTIDRRVQVHDADLDPARNANALYFMEGHYVNADDAVAGNGDNNASYRRIALIEPEPLTYTFVVRPEWSTQRGQPAVRAWADHDPEVVETDIRVPGEGLFILAAKAWAVEPGIWRYSYALQNLNSDRSARAFHVPLPPGAQVMNVYFHDIDHHSGEPFDNTDWTVAVDETGITWSTDPYDVNPNANALRFSSLFTFVFDSLAAPDPTTVTVTLFKPGFPEEVQARSIGPKLEVIDCNENGIPDNCDVSCASPDCAAPCGESADCNGNGVPDECERDCDQDGIPDQCEIEGCSPGDLSCADCNANGVPDGCEPDCDGNGIPDDCLPPGDDDGDGVDNCRDLCPQSTPSGACVCPALDRCCWDVTLCIMDYPRENCLAEGGTPDCIERPCRQGCLLGDDDRDGDVDLHDTAVLQRCFSGEGNAATAPCRFIDDMDDDGDVDLTDYAEFQPLCQGPQ